MTFRASREVALAASGISAVLAALTGCGTDDSPPSTTATAITATLDVIPSSGCGFDVTSGTYSSWPGGYQGYVRLTNRDGVDATRFDIVLDLGDGGIQSSWSADFRPSGPDFIASEPDYLRWQPIGRGGSYEFGFIGTGHHERIRAYVVSIDGSACDTTAPVVRLTANRSLFTAAGSLELNADASDSVGVRRVRFYEDGQLFSEDTTAPFSASLAIAATRNGRHVYTARAVDPSGNAATSAEVSVVVAVGNRFVGNVWGSGVADDPDFATYWNQVTPGNAGKWGSVEDTRDRMDWADLDRAYDYAEAHGVPFRLHTLIWGQQQPGWLAALPPAEQRQELEQWMSLLAARYPNIALIDVVNEPMHSQPLYKDALGGDGTTGWDWVVTAFQLARHYFPRAQLLLNDYQVLVQESFTADYLRIVQLLQARGLIDGIGEQGHFLERADLATVRTNLATLASTGLGIYISELDVPFADDARQANALRDLFTLFWSSPSVLGITLWGYREHEMWQPDAFLLHADGSARPALQWLACYHSGRLDCTVPPYVPVPRVGDEIRLRVQAEDFDDEQGLIAAGGIIAYTDAGDWVRYQGVTFDSRYTSFRMRYAKGSSTAGTLTVHLDSLASPPVASVSVPSTGDWGAYTTMEIPFPAVSGVHDVYLRFNDVGGFGNFDYFDFGLPSRSGMGGRVDLEAESYDRQSGIDDYGGVIGGADTGDYLVYANVLVDPSYAVFQAHYARGASGGGEVEVHLDAVDGPVAAHFGTVDTGGWGSYIDASTVLRASAGAHDLYVVFTGGYMGNFDRFSLVAGELPPRAGDGNTLRLEAESFDSGGDVVNYGPVIGNVDDGDRLRFENVVFEDTYRRLVVRYSKGSATPATLEVRLDSAAGAPLLTLPITTTGDWGNYVDTVVDLPLITGTHDVLLSFAMVGSSGVGNFDYFELSSI